MLVGSDMRLEMLPGIVANWCRGHYLDRGSDMRPLMELEKRVGERDWM